MGGGPYATGIVGVYDTLSGAAIAVTPVGRGPAALAVDALHGHVYVASTGDPRGATGSVTILDAASGASLAVLRPARMALKPRARASRAISSPV